MSRIEKEIKKLLQRPGEFSVASVIKIAHHKNIKVRISSKGHPVLTRPDGRKLTIAVDGKSIRKEYIHDFIVFANLEEEDGE